MQGPPETARQAPAGTARIVSFWLRGQLFALPIERVRETIALGKRPITRVFQTPDFVLGIVNLRGTILAVLDLGRYLGLGRGSTGETSRVLVVEGEALRKSAGLLVDAIAPWQTMSPQALLPPPPTLRGERAACVRGVIMQTDERPLTLLDVDAVIGAPELRPFRRTA